MRAIRKIGFFSLLVLATLFVQNASATLVLPESSFAQAENNWQGNRIFEEGGFNVLIDFAVYDTENLQPGSDEEALVAQLDVLGRYIYAYQIFNHPTALEEVGSFEIFGIDEPPLDVYVDSIDALSDSDNPLEEGIEPSSASFNPSHTRGVWGFSEDDGHVPLSAGVHSWFLVFSSDFAPVPGDYEIKGEPPEEGEFPIPPGIPEPATVALLALGGSLILTKRRKSVQ